MMKIHCLQHVAYENPGTILEWAALNKHSITYTHFFKKKYFLPTPADFDMLLIMGGYMNVDEEEKFRWLKDEKELIRKSVDAGKKVIGICLGSQLIASALGSKVYKGKEKEIGFFPIHFTQGALSHPLFEHFKNPYTVFHWHGDTFDLPASATLIASTDVCRNQAFLVGKNVLALQFHFEMNEDTVEGMILHDGNELNEKGSFIATADEIFSNYPCLEQNKKDLFEMLNKYSAY
jgi:GMP synthase-like glutamine amidotransferase